MNMHQLYKKIGFLIVFLMMCGGVKGQNNICISTSGNIIPVPQTSFSRIITDGCSRNRDMSRYITNYSSTVEYSLDGGLSYTTYGGGIWASSISVSFANCCNTSSFLCGGCCDIYQNYTSTTVETFGAFLQGSIFIPYSALSNIGVATSLKVRVRSEGYSNYGMGPKSEIYNYVLYPPPPVVNSITIGESCANADTGVISINATAYADAKIYLTNDPMPLPPYNIPPGCNPPGTATPPGPSADYPFCGGSIPASNPSTTDNILNPSNSNVAKIYTGLARRPQPYYLTIVNVVSEPYLCGAIGDVINREIYLTDAVPIMKGNYGAGVPTTSVIPSNWPAVSIPPIPPIPPTNNMVQANPLTVEVPTIGYTNNSLFVSNFTCPSICNGSDGTITISGEGGNPVDILGNPVNPVDIFVVQKNGLSFSFGASLTTTVMPGNSIYTPRYTWGGTLTGLSEGIYKITVTSCGQVLSNTVTIRKPFDLIPVDNLVPANPPPSPSTAFTVTNPRCRDAANGGNSLGTAEMSITIKNIPDETYDFSPASRIISWNISKDGVSGQPFDYEHITISSGVETLLSVSGSSASSVNNNTDFGNDLGTNTCKIRFKDLPPGNYTVNLGLHLPSIFGTQIACNGGVNPLMKTYTFTVTAPQLLGLAVGTQVVATPLTCNGVANGKIQLTGAGNPTGYVYTLFKLNVVSGDYDLMPNVGAVTTFCLFDNLNIGTYKVQIKRNNDPNCTDMYPTDPIIITQPLPVTFTNVVKLNISCNGAAAINGGDGSISATIAGGTINTGAVTYRYQLWELPGNIGTVYVLNTTRGVAGTMSITSPSTSFTIAGLDIGTYKVKIIDDANCADIFLMQDNGSGGTTDVFIVSNPPALAFTSVVVTEVRCFGTIATIVPTVDGGTPPYRFYYTTTANPTTEVLFTGLTSLLPATYSIFVKDSRDCRLDYAPTSPITLSFAAATVTMPLSMGLATVPLFSSFAISCRGGRNGSIILIPQGGAFTTPNEYTYKLNSNPAILSSVSPFVFAGLGAGTYVVSVTDRYGCEVSQTFNLTESAAVISLASTGTTSTVCPNDYTGTATVVPSGGAGVGYKVAHRKKMPSPGVAYSGFTPITASGFTFTSLRADTYEIILEDANGCSNLTTPLEVVVNSVNPVIQIVPTVVNVSCHAGNDGSIVVNHPGFVATAYKWTGRSETTNTITNLIHASYEVEITYSGGCKEKFMFPITQPDVLNATSASTIACDKLNDGTITLDATGGTTPYSFSLNGGTTWTTNIGTIPRKIFANLSPGVYQPRIRDAKNCLKTLADITIRERGDDPHPRFLVATRQNALDELVLINTSYPTPTSTVWTLDPRATVISQSTEEARVKFPVAGNYSVTMNATFNGCSYVITKNLVISNFDPNDPGVIVGLRPITSATIVPNPTMGSFVLDVVLTKKQYTKIVILDAMGNIRYEQNKNTDRTLGFSESINLPADLLSGLYILRVITDNDAREIRFTLTR